jgi:hypothetical protein
MKNLKKVLALVLALSMVLSSYTVAFAAETVQAADKAEVLYDLGLFAGESSSEYVPNLEGTTNREQAINMLARVLGWDATTAPANPFSDVSDWAADYVAIAAQSKVTVGIGNGLFGGQSPVTDRQVLAWVTRELGYGDAYNDINVAVQAGLITSAEAMAIKMAVDGGSEATINRGDLVEVFYSTLTAVNKNTGNTVVEDLIAAGVVDQAKAKAFDLLPVDTSVLAVESIKLNTAKSFQVTFNKPVEDTDEVEFAVKRGSIKTTVTTKWNSAKTVATLEAASKLAETDFTITVSVDDELLAEEKLTVEKEKVDRIEYDSDVIVRMNDYQGIVGFTVYNQYGEDVTDGALGRTLTFNFSTNGGSDNKVDFKAGVITLTHGTATSTYGNQLKDLPTVVVTVNNTDGFVQTKSFTVSDTVGVISEFSLLGIVDENGESVDFTFDDTKTYYLDYEAFDLNGKKITNYTALQASMYGNDILQINSTNDKVDVKPEKHPDNSSQMVYRLELDTTQTLDYDTPITFIAIAPFIGKNSNLTVTLYRRNAVESFSMYAPAETVSLGKTVEIPFVAYDQNGNEVTKYTDLNQKVTFSPNILYFVEQADGSAKLYGDFTSKGIQYITGRVVNSITGAYSQMSIDVRDAGVPTTIEPLRHTMAYSANATWDQGVDKFTVADQFDNAVNLKTEAGSNDYQIRVETSNNAIVSLGTSATAGLDEVVITGNDKVYFRGGNTAGTTTITYTLERISDGKIIDTASAIVRNVALKDVTSITIAQPKELYMVKESRILSSTTTGAVALPAGLTKIGEHDSWRYKLDVTGVTNTGLKVKLADSTVEDLRLSNDRFSVYPGKTEVIANGDFDGDDSDSTSVTVYVNNGERLLSANTTVTAKKATPLASSVSVSIDDNDAFRENLLSLTNDVVTISATQFGNLFDGKSILDLTTLGQTPAMGKAAVKFTVKSQYGNFVVSNVIASSGAPITVDSATGEITGTVTSGDEFSITAITNSGVSKVIKFVIK